MAVRSSIRHNFHIVSNKPKKEVILVSFYNSFILGGVYIPPRESPYFASFDRFEYLSESISLCQQLGLPFAIIGDLNSRFGNRKQTIRNPESDSEIVFRIDNQDTKINSNGRELLQLCDSHQCVIMTGKCWDPTFTCHRYNGMSVVDTGFCSLGMLEFVLCGSVVDLFNYSDHSAIAFSVSVPDVTSATTERGTSRQIVSRQVLNRCLRSSQYDSIIRDFCSSPRIMEFTNRLNRIFDSGQLLSKMQLSDLFESFYSSFNDSVKSIFPITTQGNRKNASQLRVNGNTFSISFDHQYLKAKRQCYRARRLLRKHKSPQNYASYVYWIKLKKSNYRRCRRLSESMFIRNLFRPGNSANLWSTIKPSICTPYSGPIDIETLTSHLQSIAEGKYEFCSQLSENAHQHLLANDVMSFLPSSTECSLLNDFPYSTVLRPKTGKAVGLDGWSGELIRFLERPLSSVFPKLFVLCLRSGCTPTQWDSDIKVPVQKPGRSPKLVSSLRPITLVCTPMKQFELWIRSILAEFYTTSEFQAGFKETYSCATRIFVLRSIIDEHIYNINKPVFACFVDFSSFFDTVRTDLLCHHLLQSNVPGYLVKLIHGMLTSVSAKVSIGGKLGRQFHCKVGLRQGSVISPTLATAFLDKITEFLEAMDKGVRFTADSKITHLFYADDFVIFTESFDTLQSVLNGLSDFCRKIGLHVNAEKTFWIVFARKKIRGLKDIVWENGTLNRVEEITYLGNTIKWNGSFSSHFNKCKQKADRAFSIVLNFQKKYPQVTFSHFLHLYFTLVYPCLVYSSEVFCWGYFDVYDDVFLQHLRKYFGLPKSVSGKALHWLTGTLPVYGKMWKTAFKFWGKIVGLSASRFETTALKNFKNLANETNKSWFAELSACLERVGFQGSLRDWDEDTIKSKFHDFSNHVDAYLKNDLERWKLDTSYDFLISYHPEHSAAKFLDQSNFGSRRVLTRVVLRCCSFESITGSRHKVPKPVRYCRNCLHTYPPRVVLGNEIHYLCECAQFVSARTTCCNRLNCSPQEIPSYIFSPGCNNLHPHSQYASLARFIQSFVRLPDSYNNS